MDKNNKKKKDKKKYLLLLLIPLLLLLFLFLYHNSKTSLSIPRTNMTLYEFAVANFTWEPHYIVGFNRTNWFLIQNFSSCPTNRSICISNSNPLVYNVRNSDIYKTGKLLIPSNPNDWKFVYKGVLSQRSFISTSLINGNDTLFINFYSIGISHKNVSINQTSNIVKIKGIFGPNYYVGWTSIFFNKTKYFIINTSDVYEFSPKVSDNILFNNSNNNFTIYEDFFVLKNAINKNLIGNLPNNLSDNWSLRAAEFFIPKPNKTYYNHTYNFTYSADILLNKNGFYIIELYNWSATNILTSVESGFLKIKPPVSLVGTPMMPFCIYPLNNPAAVAINLAECLIKNTTGTYPIYINDTGVITYNSTGRIHVIPYS